MNNIIYPQHPAHKYSFEELLNNLTKLSSKGLIDIKEKDTLKLFNYNNETVHSKQWNDFTLSSRGLILDTTNKRIVATPFPKFFNMFENGIQIKDLPNGNFEVSNKYDGSLGICYFYNNEWHVVTRGSFDSPQALWATEYLRKHMPSNMNKDITYLFEIIYKENRIVVDYGYFEGLVRIGAYNNITGQELIGEDFESSMFYQANMPPRQLIKGKSIEDLLDIAKILSHQDEGFVVRFENGLRIKIKSDEYITVHKIISRITPLGVWEMLMSGADLKEITLKLPEEFLKDFNQIINLLNKQIDYIYKHNLIMRDIGFNKLTRKQLAEWLTDKKWLYSNDVIPAIAWMIYDNKSEVDIKKNILKGLRPTGNVLKGYIPSSSMNRFEVTE